jgi:hypothetical protein
VRRGYVPDGRGLCRGGLQLRHGDAFVVDDDLALYFTKQLRVGRLGNALASARPALH